MSDFEKLLPKLLGAVYSHVEGDVRLTSGEEEMSASTAKPMMLFVMGAEEHVFADLRSTDKLCGLCFAFRDKERAHKLAGRLDPSFVVLGKESVRLIYLMDTHERAEELFHDLREADDDEAYVDDAFPLPYRDFSLDPQDELAIKAQADLALYTLDEIEAAVFGPPDDTPSGVEDTGLSADNPTPAVEVTTLNDAEVHGKIPQAYRDKLIRASRAKGRDERTWKTSPEFTFGVFLDNYLTQHKVGRKDGWCFVPGALIDGKRSNQSVEALYMMGLDVDSGESLADTFAIIQKMGLFAILYTTHSHLTTEIEIKQDRFYKWASDNGKDPDPTDESVKEFLTDQGKYHLDVIASARYVDTVHEVTGVIIKIETRPIDKFRIVFLLDEPYIIAKQKMSQKDAIHQWREMILGLAKTIGIRVDRAATDCSRLFYEPRHGQGSEFKILINAGKKLLNWSKIKKDGSKDHATSDPFDQAAHVMGGRMRGRAMSPKLGIDLQSWASESAAGFMPSVVLQEYCPENIRRELNPSKFAVLCPFDDDHSNPGDPEDQGCYIEDAGEAETFSFRCSHDSCAGRDRLAMLEKAMNDGWFPDDVLVDTRYSCLVVEDEDEDAEGESEEEKEPAKATQADITRAITKAENLKTGASTADIKELLKTLIPMDQFDRNRVIGVMSKSLKITIPQIAALYKTVEANNPIGGNVAIYDPEAVTKDIVKRNAALKNEKRPVVINNPDYPKDTERHLLRELGKINAGLDGHDAKHLFFRHGENRVKITPASDGVWEVAALTKTKLNDAVGRHICFIELRDSSFAEVFPPDTVADQAVASDDMPLLELLGFAALPFYNKEFQLVSEPGYDPFSLRILKLRKEIATLFTAKDQKLFKANPTFDDVQDAIAELDFVFGDFPFDDGPDMPASKGRSSRAHFYALLLQTVVRDLIDGPTPLYCVNKPQAGTGSSKMLEAALWIVKGKKIGTTNVVTNDEEQRKQITSQFIAGDEVIFFDNVNTKVDSGLFSNLATAGVWSDRMLGQSKQTSIPNRALVVFAGNNVTFSEENSRRVCTIRLDLKKDPNQMTRTFQCEDIDAYVRENQLELYGCLLTIVNYWIKQGHPEWKGDPLISFERWCAVMGGILQTVGIEGFLENRYLTSNANNADRLGWAQFYQHLHGEGLMTTPKTMGELLTIYDNMKEPPALVINGGGRVTSNMAEDRQFDAFERVIGRAIGQVHRITVKDRDIDVSLKRMTDDKSKRVTFKLTEFEEVEEAA